MENVHTQEKNKGMKYAQDRAKRDWLILCGIQSFYWITMTLHSSFLVFYLNGCNYRTTTIAFITLGMTFVNLFAQPLWGYIADAVVGIRKAIMICLLGSLPTLLLLPFLVQYVWVIVVLNLLYAVFNYPLQGLTDSITNIAAERNCFVVYGFTRGCGSLSSALASLLIGYILNYTDTKLLFSIEAGILFMAFLFMTNYENVSYGYPKKEAVKKERQSNIGNAVLELIKNPAYLAVLLSVTLMNVGNRTTLFFVPILIDEYGGSNVHLGYSLFLNCIFMAPCMVIQSYMIKRGIKNYVPLMVGGFFGVLRAFLMYFARTLPMLVGLQILQSFAYGFLQPSTVTAAGDVSSLEIRATAISLAIAVTTVFSTFLGQIGGSILSEIVGIHATFVISAAVTFLGILCYMPMIYRDKRNG